MIEHPSYLHIVGSRRLADGAGQQPFADQRIQQGILERWLLGKERSRYTDDQGNVEQCGTKPHKFGQSHMQTSNSAVEESMYLRRRSAFGVIRLHPLNRRIPPVRVHWR